MVALRTRKEAEMQELYNFYNWMQPIDRLAMVVSLSFGVIGTWGLIFFFPRKNLRGQRGAFWLVLAIWLGFAGGMLNALWWKVIYLILLYKGTIEHSTLLFIGNVWADMFAKGLGALAIYLHFYARYRSIPDNERGHWTPLAMGFYPDKNKWAVRALTIFKRSSVIRYARKRKAKNRTKP
jgi:hypothetical protein